MMKHAEFYVILLSLLVFSLGRVDCTTASMIGNAKLFSPEIPQYYNQFGKGVDISPDGGSALVGEHRETWSDGTGGNAYYFSSLSSTGMKLPSGDQISQNAFGRAVALSDDGSTAVIGAPWNDIGANSSQGAVYVYTYSNGWIAQQKIVDNTAGEYDYFGDSVDVSDDGNTIIIGHPGYKNGSGIGAAHIYVRSGSLWVLQKKIIGFDGQLTFFGSSVALSGDGNTAIVSTPYAGGGFVYIFVRSGGGWYPQSKFTATGAGYFGSAVDLSDDGNTALIGAYGTGPYQTGAAYIFVRNNGIWFQQGQLLAPDRAPGDWFGNSVALSNDGNIAVVGAVLANSAYQFTRQGSAWTHQSTLSSSDPNTTSLGASVAVSDDGQTVLVGDDEYTVSGVLAQGAVFVFRPFVPMTGPNLLLLNSP